MNRYYIEIPFSCTTYGKVKGFVFANSEDEAEILAGDVDNIEDAEYIDHDTDNTEHYYESMEIELRESNIPEDEVPDYISELPPDLPEYFLNEINLI